MSSSNQGTVRPDAAPWSPAREGDAELAVREILNEVLPPEMTAVREVDPTLPLVDLGCDSIDLIQIATKLKQRYGLVLQVEEGSSPSWSLRDLAELVERGQSERRRQ
jgi:acyl carrier protein